MQIIVDSLRDICSQLRPLLNSGRQRRSGPVLGAAWGCLDVAIRNLPANLMGHWIQLGPEGLSDWRMGALHRPKVVEIRADDHSRDRASVRVSAGQRILPMGTFCWV